VQPKVKVLFITTSFEAAREMARNEQKSARTSCLCTSKGRLSTRRAKAASSVAEHRPTPSRQSRHLLQGADLSTYLHETGHWALDTYARIAAAADAPAEIRADMDRVLKQYGVESLDKWHGMTLEEQRPLHERFAREFEAYLMSGKAPSRELVPFFQRIRAWMVNIYKSLSGLNVQLSPEVRGVFDRMLASDDAIREAQAARVFEPLFKEKPAGVSAEDWARYEEMGAQATNDAVQALQEKSLRDMKWLSGAKARALKDLQKQAKQARDAVTREVQEEVGGMAVYRLQDFLKGKKLKDGARRASTPSSWPRPSASRTARELERALAEAPARKEVIEGLTDRYMIERHGELASPEALENAASEAVHNDARARFVATGLKILTNSPIPARELLRGAKEAAHSAIGERRVRELNPREHEAAETKANREALKLVAKDPLAAAQAQRAALLNNQLVKATRGGDGRCAQRPGILQAPAKRQLAGKDSGGVPRPGAAAAGPLRPAHGPHARAGRRKEHGVAGAVRRKALGHEVRRRRARGHDRERQPRALQGHDRDGVSRAVDAVKSLEHLGREVQKVQDGKESRRLADVAAEAVAQLDKLPKRSAETNRGLSRIEDKWVGFKSFARSVQASLLKMEQMIDWLDHYNPNGVFNRLVFRKIADAEGARNDLDLKVSKAWEEAVRALPAEVLKEGRRTYEMPGVIDALTGKPQRLTWGEKIALAGIRGDAEHFSKLLRGEKWDPEAVLKFLDGNMSKAEWQFVRSIAGTFQELFPLKQQMMRELGATSPKEVARIAFQRRTASSPAGTGPSPTTRRAALGARARRAARGKPVRRQHLHPRGHLHRARADAKRQLRQADAAVDRRAAAPVLKDEIRDITTRRAIIEADRFLRQPDVRRAIVENLSQEHYDQFNGWLLSLANDAAVKPSELQMWDRLAHEIRTRVTMVGLGFRISTMVMHGATAAGESVAEAGFKTMGKGIFSKKTWAGLVKQLGPEWLDKGLASFSREGNWEANSNFITERSPEMRHRMNEIERDVREQLRDIHLKLADPATGAAMRAKLAVEQRAYQGIAMLDYASALPTWMGAYLKAMTPKAKGGLELGEQDAVYFADKTVRNAHGGGGVKDMAAIQRGNEFQKLFTMFYTFWNHNINRIIDTAKRVKELPAGYAEAKETGDWAGFRGDVGNLVLRSLMYTLGVQAVHHMMHPPKDEDGEEGWLKWFAKQMAASAFGGVPLFRDVVGHYAGGKDYEMSPVAALVQQHRPAPFGPEGRQHARALDQARHDRGGLYLGACPWANPAPPRSSSRTCGTGNSTPRTSPNGGGASPPGT
jgi:hypothetical protein